MKKKSYDRNVIISVSATEHIHYLLVSLLGRCSSKRLLVAGAVLRLRVGLQTKRKELVLFLTMQYALLRTFPFPKEGGEVG